MTKPELFKFKCIECGCTAYAKEAQFEGLMNIIYEDGEEIDREITDTDITEIFEGAITCNSCGMMHYPSEFSEKT